MDRQMWNVHVLAGFLIFPHCALAELFRSPSRIFGSRPEAAVVRDSAGVSAWVAVPCHVCDGAWVGMGLSLQPPSILLQLFMTYPLGLPRSILWDRPKSSLAGSFLPRGGGGLQLCGRAEPAASTSGRFPRENEPPKPSPALLLLGGLGGHQESWECRIHRSPPALTGQNPSPWPSPTAHLG